MSARILVVDDDPWILRMVTASLRKRSFTVDTARDGRQALERVRAHAPAVIVTDVMMPVMDGWAFVRQLRQDPRLATIPVIFLTALGKDQAKLRSMGLTEDDYLTKPFRFDDLERRVDAALSARKPPPPPAGYGTNPNSGVHPLPGYPPQGTNPNSGVHPLPTNPYAYPPGQYQYPPPPPGQPAQYPYGYGQYPGQYPPPAQPGQYQYPPPPPSQYPAPGAPAPPPVPGDGAVAAPPRRAADRQRRATGLHGKLEQLGLSSLLVMMEMERKQGVLSLAEANSEILGKLFLRGGRVIAAELESHPGLDGKECVYRMLAWKAGTFSFSACTIDAEDTVQASTTHLLMEGARLIDEAGRDDESL
ncbi:MAG: response regulator [Myxococcales bacterium]|nr:response regulator [Myxococcales bacterium]